MKKTVTHLKEILFFTLYLVLAIGLAPNSYGATLFLKAENAKTSSTIFSLSNLSSLGKSLNSTPLEDVEAVGKTFYWVPFGSNNRGTGVWSDLSHWATSSGGTEKHTSLPTSSDNVIFDSKSFTFSGQKVTLDVDANVGSISWEVTRTISFDANGKLINVSGSFQASTYLTLLGTNGFHIKFAAPLENTPINMAGRSFPLNTTVTFEGTGSWLLQSALNTGPNGVINLNEGTLVTNNQSISAITFNSIGSKTRSLLLSTSSFSNLNTWNVDSSLNLEAKEASITLNGSDAHTFNGGGKEYRFVTLYGPNAIINNSNSFKDLSLRTNDPLATDYTLTLESGQTQTIESLFTPGTESSTTLKSSTIGSAAFIDFTSYGLCTDYLIISDIQASGPGDYYVGITSERLGNTTGWHFTSCGSSVYSPKASSDYDTTSTSTTVTSDGSNKWQEIKYNGELIGAIKDGGNILGEVTIDFQVSSDSSRAVKNTEGANINLMPRNWRVKATNQPSGDKPVSIRLYGVQNEFDAYKSATSAVFQLGELAFTTYSSLDITENCEYIDNLAKGSTTSFSNNVTFSTAGNYFTAEVSGITDFTEFYLHNGTSAINFVASQPVKAEPEIVVEEMDFTAHWNAKTVKLKWTALGKTTVSYDVEKAYSPESKEFKTIIQNAPRQNSGNAAVAVYHAEDFNPEPVPANYYRLKRTNADGTITYSQTLKVDNKAHAAAVQAAPNPFTDKVKLTVNAEKAGELNIKLLNEQGNVALEKKVKVAKGTSTTELVMGSKVKAGIYLLVTELNGERVSQRLIKQ
ncbi:T9SS type A sorting domain-containing protein [Rufibacter latericius]|uniref:T9SS C-terminal target domain-containing protein n=1 Tax=Rufibacter latericius TaxID=2487040 RepID=A0A3M9MDM2_9BACT|nr:T9SS type A sorting domain-containing protein [Rufibacter latericius]RNI23646.1 T9SS C-terminal target domain-containing protein [Rufibacter latericius]